MSLKEKLKTGLKIGILGTAVVISSYAVCDKIFCQGQYISKSNKFILPGLLGRTEIIEKSSGCYEVIENKIPFGINRYKDKPDKNGECDLLVDEIGITRFNETKILFRRKDYQTHKEEFDESDKQFLKIIGRF